MRIETFEAILKKVGVPSGDMAGTVDTKGTPVVQYYHRSRYDSPEWGRRGGYSLWRGFRVGTKPICAWQKRKK